MDNPVLGMFGSINQWFLDNLSFILMVLCIGMSGYVFLEGILFLKRAFSQQGTTRVKKLGKEVANAAMAAGTQLSPMATYTNTPAEDSSQQSVELVKELEKANPPVVRTWMNSLGLVWTPRYDPEVARAFVLGAHPEVVKLALGYAQHPMEISDWESLCHNDAVLKDLWPFICMMKL